MRTFIVFILTALVASTIPFGDSLAAKPVPKSYSAPKANGTIQKVSYTGTAGTSSAFASTTRLIRIVCSTACWTIVGTTATASNGMYMGVGIPEFLSVSGGQTISAIQASAGGDLSVVEYADP